MSANISYYIYKVTVQESGDDIKQENFPKQEETDEWWRTLLEKAFDTLN